MVVFQKGGGRFGNHLGGTVVGFKTSKEWVSLAVAVPQRTTSWLTAGKII